MVYFIELESVKLNLFNQCKAGKMSLLLCYILQLLLCLSGFFSLGTAFCTIFTGSYEKYIYKISPRIRVFTDLSACLGKQTCIYCLRRHNLATCFFFFFFILTFYWNHKDKEKFVFSPVCILVLIFFSRKMSLMQVYLVI